jgi:hypothetical protein
MIRKNKKVDVAIQVYGKPYQTLVALKTLMMHSGKHIDKIYFIQERDQPYGGVDFSFVIKRFDNIVLYTPKYFLSLSPADKKKYSDNDYRLSIRYQYAWENTEKKYLYITHNDVIYKGDIVGKMLNVVNKYEYADIGQIGLCVLCPAFFGKKCNVGRYAEYNPSYEEVLDLVDKYPLKTKEQYDAFMSDLKRKISMPLPLCRLNEHACLINLEKIRQEVVPYGETEPFGAYGKMDLGFYWFRELNLKGFKFKNYDIDKYCRHGWGTFTGHQALLNSYYYASSEDKAIEYFEETFGEVL